jgi:inorganic phosphate transporter, PiT family
MAFLILVIVVALIFDFTNGFHDSANAIATSVSTRALSPRVAMAMAAILNMVGAFAGQKVAQTVGKGIVALPSDSLNVVLAALIGAIIWNLITWRFGLPSSSSHALIGGLVGATLVAVGTSGVEWKGIWDKVVVPMVTSPVIGFVFAFLIMAFLVRLVHRWALAPVNRTFRFLQPISAGAVAFAHGSNDAQKTMGIITLALVTTGHLSETAPIPDWVIVVAALSMAAGTYFGGWRIIHTLGNKVIKLDPIHGFAAETSAATVIFGAAHLGFPISTTQTITTSIMGSGATSGLRAVKWNVAGNIAWAWVLTLPAAAGMAALVYVAAEAIGRVI